MSFSWAHGANGYLPRPQVVAAYALVLVALLAGTTPVLTGDGYEYIGMTMHMAQLHRPAMTVEQAAELEARLARLEPSFRSSDLVGNKLSDSAGRYDQTHFWFYSLVAVPGYWLVSLAGLHPNYAFALLHMCLLLAGFWIVSARLDAASSLLLFVGPVIWFVDKAHTEVFTFVLLAVAVTVIVDRPWWTLVCLGAASTQASPIAGLVPLAAVLVVVADPGVARQRRFWWGAGVGLGLATLAPAYYLLRYGVYQIMVSELRWPTAQELAAVVWDPTIGLVGNNPVFLLVTGFAVVMAAAKELRVRAPDLWLSVLAVALFLPAFAQTNNVNHGAKIGLTRYALWLMPLAIPWLARAARRPPVAWSGVMVPLMLATCLWSLFAYNPARPEGFGPTRLSAMLWNRRPGLDNPIPEIFTENTWLEEEAPFPAATPNCSKLLLLDGVWPTPCVPVEVPDECRGERAMCYANRVADGYEFVRAGRAFGYPTRPSTRTWPRGAEGIFVPWLVERWWEARAYQAAGGDSMLQATENIGRVRTYEGEGSLLVYFHRPRPGALARLRVPWSASGLFIEPAGGKRIASVAGGPVGSGELWELPLPVTRGDVVLVLSR